MPRPRLTEFVIYGNRRMSAEAVERLKDRSRIAARIVRSPRQPTPLPRKRKVLCKNGHNTSSASARTSNRSCKACNHEGRRRRSRKTYQAVSTCFDGMPCENCSTILPYRKMHFHHVDPATKSFEIGHSYRRKALTTIFSEIAKCLYICESCHTEIHRPRRVAA